MAFNEPSPLHLPVVILLACCAAGVACSDAPPLGVCILGLVLGNLFLLAGIVLSIVENAFVGHSYEPHADVFRPFTGFMPRYYMFLHPFLLGLLFASSWAVVTGPTFSNNHAGMKLAGAVGAAGALPVS